MNLHTKSKKALIHVIGMQVIPDVEDDTIEDIMPGACQKIGDYYYIKYEEMQEGFTEKTDVLVKVKNGYLEMTKKGLIDVNMMIEEEKVHHADYLTPFGNMLFTIHGKEVAVTEDEDGVYIGAKYSMDVNQQYLSENNISIHVKYCK